MQNFNEEATDFLEAAVSHDPKNPVLWVILGKPVRVNVYRFCT